MAQGICKECEFNNNGWCNKRNTNKGLKDLTECEYRKDKKVKRIEAYTEQAKFDLEMDKEYSNKTESEIKWQEGIIRGLEIALRILRD